MMTDKKMIAALVPPEDARWDGVGDALKRAIKFLRKQGEPLTELQQTAIGFAIEVSHRNESDTWDHLISEGTTAAEKKVARLLLKHLDD